MQVYELNTDAVGRMIPVDLAMVDRPPASPIGEFEFHGCVCGVASFVGQPPWELHNGGDELIHVLAGETRLTLRSGGGEETRVLKAGDVVVIPRGCWHRNQAETGVTALVMTPREGNEHAWNDPRAS